MRKKVYQLIVLDEYGINVKTADKYPGWEDLRKLLGGFIEMVSFNLQGNKFLMIIEEDCVFNKKKNNYLASKLCGRQVFGPAVILQADGEKIAAFNVNETPHVINHLMFALYMDGVIKVVIE